MMNYGNGRRVSVQFVGEIDGFGPWEVFSQHQALANKEGIGGTE